MLIDRVDFVGGTLHMRPRQSPDGSIRRRTPQSLRKKVANVCASLYPVPVELEEMEELCTDEPWYLIDVIDEAHDTLGASVAVPPQLTHREVLPFLSFLIHSGVHQRDETFF